VKVQGNVRLSICHLDAFLTTQHIVDSMYLHIEGLQSAVNISDKPRWQAAAAHRSKLQQNFRKAKFSQTDNPRVTYDLAYSTAT